MTAQNVHLSSGTGSFTNSGLISATAGNVRFNTPNPAQNITIANAGGTIEASNSIYIRGPDYAGDADATLLGGDWFSKQVNIYSGGGTANADIGKITGRINTHAWEAHVKAHTDNLIIGDMDLPGDPSYFNTGGAVTIAGNLNFSGEALAIVAATNIVTAAGAGTADSGPVCQ